MTRRRSNSTASTNNSERSKQDLWKGSISRDIGEGVIVEIVGMESKSHTVYARVKPTGSASSSKATIGNVVEVMVDEGWKDVAKDILEKHIHIQPDTYPPANELLKLGAVWILNETAYAKGENTHAHRLKEEEASDIPDWENMTLRVHYVPDRFHAAHEVDWSKHCRGLLVGGSVKVDVGGEVPHVPVTGLPDYNDGVIVYEDSKLGYAVLNKPGAMPVRATMSNHAEDVVTCFSEALKNRLPEVDQKVYVTLSQRIETEMHGLILVSTNKQFTNYMSKLEHPNDDNDNIIHKSYKCLVCIKDENDLDRLEKFQQSGSIITHYMDQKSPSPKKFVRHKPKIAGRSEWVQCQMRIAKVGDESFRAACVSSSMYGQYNTVDSNLAHRLWGVGSQTPADDLGVKYVMEIEVQMLTERTHQLQGQLAALGVPIVGDSIHGGGTCEHYVERHGWRRVGMQCCELSFLEPKWEEAEVDGKKTKSLVKSDKKCFCRLNNAWWTEDLVKYEFYQQREWEKTQN